MVCAKCQRLEKQTKLATPDVKKKNEMYLGSSTSAAAKGAKKGPTLGSTGVSKSKLLSKGAKNPYAAYASSCDSCKTRVDAGRKYCQKCAYSKQLCAMCGKALAGEGSSKAPVVQGQKFNAK